MKKATVSSLLLIVVGFWMIISSLLWSIENSRNIVLVQNFIQYRPEKRKENSDRKGFGALEHNDGQAVSYAIPRCHCKRFSGTPLSQNPKSTCSKYATSRGPGQKVFSYSYYRPRYVQGNDALRRHFEEYLGQMEEKLVTIRDNFEGWLVRFYHNISLEDSNEQQYLCDLFCKYDFFDPCNVTDLPTFDNLSKRQPIGRMWRFAVMGDPTVDIFASRDTDSAILNREIVAVKEWLDSSKRFHIMRDHPKHLHKLFAGLWGARNIAFLTVWRDRMLFAKPQLQKNFDQQLLAEVVWPRIQKGDLLQHTSYNCENFPGAVPFSTRREGFFYVGWGRFKEEFVEELGHQPCFVVCRPNNHKDWKYC